jgi:hypothetical protein
MIFPVPRTYIASPPGKIPRVSHDWRRRTKSQYSRQINPRGYRIPWTGIYVGINPSAVQPSVIITVISVNVAAVNRSFIDIYAVAERESKIRSCNAYAVISLGICRRRIIRR